MGLAVLAAIIFVYMIMVALYDSFVYPFVVLFSIPLAVVGAFLALALTMNTFNTFTQLGLIMLVGLVAKNAILLVDFANEQKKLGHSSFDALIEAGKERLRPILMTTIAMVIGMLPIALGKGAGGEWKNGLGWVLIGGLTSSMFLTLVFVPVVYLATDNLIAFVNRLLGRDKKIENQTADVHVEVAEVVER
jgi:HAE1 family hydrophobic/amphiphilic exporter-1